MRIRQVKPEFWTDPLISRLSEGARLLYIGLWNIADDGGFFVWDVPYIGAQLMAYEVPAKRERRIERYSLELRQTDRLLVLECGHAKIPTLPLHQRISGGRRVETEVKRHDFRECPRKSSDISGSPRMSEESTAGIGIGKVGYGKVSYARDDLKIVNVS